MKPEYITHNDLDIAGTGLAGYIEADYFRLVRAFGEPADGMDDGKTDAMWIILFARKQLAYIYNWKDGKNYLGEKGKAIDEITLWNVGAKQHEVMGLVAEILDLKPEGLRFGFPLYK